MLINIIKSYRNVVAICDKEILGKKFEEGRFQLDVKESFFSGQEITEEKILWMIKRMSIEDSTFNIVGPKSIETAKKAGIISDSNVKKIQGIPFALVLI
ncbi:MAG: DUF424 family protein [Candidatus Pacearchaeota archaeon]